MQTALAALPYLIGACLALVVVTLLAGLTAMLGGGEADRRRSNKLMRLRVASQGLAILLVIVYVALRKM